MQQAVVGTLVETILTTRANATADALVAALYGLTPAEAAHFAPPHRGCLSPGGGAPRPHGRAPRPGPRGPCPGSKKGRTGSAAFFALKGRVLDGRRNACRESRFRVMLSLSKHLSS